MKIILTAALLVLPLRAQSASFEDLLKTDYAGLKAAAAPAAAASKRHAARSDAFAGLTARRARADAEIPRSVWGADRGDVAVARAVCRPASGAGPFGAAG